MPGNFKVLTDDSQFQSELTQSGGKLVIADFTSSRCGPCVRIAPAFEQMANKYMNANFLKIDIQNCPNSAQSQGVTATPTFIFYRNKTKIDSFRGADIEGLEAKVRQYYGDEEDQAGDCAVPGHMDLISMVNKSGCECLNEADGHTFTNLFNAGPTYLESDADEQLIIHIDFSQAVKIHSLKILGPQQNGPKTIKLFINQPYTLDFDAAENGVAVQEIEVTPKNLEGALVSLKYVRFQKVLNITLFIMDNQDGSEVTQVSHLQFIGSPVQTTKMSDFKRIAGKKGESH